MKKILLSALFATSLFATTYTLYPGWNLLGTIGEIPVSAILANTAVRNIVIYRNGGYESSASNQFSKIPANSGFFVYTDSSTSVTIQDGAPPSSEIQKLDEDLNPTTDSTWPILKIVDANLLVEMKSSTYNAGLTYELAQAKDYCQNLVIGSVTNWRIPSLGELRALSDIYRAGNESSFIIKDARTYYGAYNNDGESYYDGQMSFDRHYDSTGTYSRNAHIICVKSL